MKQKLLITGMSDNDRQNLRRVRTVQQLVNGKFSLPGRYLLLQLLPTLLQIIFFLDLSRNDVFLAASCRRIGCDACDPCLRHWYLEDGMVNGRRWSRWAYRT